MSQREHINCVTLPTRALSRHSTTSPYEALYEALTSHPRVLTTSWLWKSLQWLMIERAGAGAGMAQARVWRGRRYGALGHKANSRARHVVFQHRSKIPNSLKNLTRNRV